MFQIGDLVTYGGTIVGCVTNTDEENQKVWVVWFTEKAYAARSISYDFKHLEHVSHV